MVTKKISTLATSVLSSHEIKTSFILGIPGMALQFLSDNLLITETLKFPAKVLSPIPTLPKLKVFPNACVSYKL